MAKSSDWAKERFIGSRCSVVGIRDSSITILSPISALITLRPVLPIALDQIFTIRGESMARKAFISTLVIAVALGLFVYFTSTGRALLGRVWGGQQRAANTAITNRVKSAVLLSRRLSAFVIGVDTKDGVVKLTGRVPTEVDKDLAGNVAKDVPEVLRVDNQLQ